MEKINTEILVSSLLVIGFDQVDALLFTFVLGKMMMDNLKSQQFTFQEEELSPLFKEYISFDGLIFK